MVILAIASLLFVHTPLFLNRKSFFLHLDVYFTNNCRTNIPPILTSTTLKEK
ncbi:hypothetical protein X975_05877, partial [Stegodyphus mimosarum]